MELILWRHAEAEAGEPDDARALTGKGHKQALKMAEWLDRILPNGCKILVSPTMRTVQTAEALGRKFKILPELGPDSPPRNHPGRRPLARQPGTGINHRASTQPGPRGRAAAERRGAGLADTQSLRLVDLPKGNRRAAQQLFAGRDGARSGAQVKFRAEKYTDPCIF